MNAKAIRDQVIAGILTATDKFIDDDYGKQVRKWLRMTKVARFFEEEKLEAIREAVKEAERRKEKEIAKSLLDILSPEIIAEKTELDIEKVKKLKRA